MFSFKGPLRKKFSVLVEGTRLDMHKMQFKLPFVEFDGVRWLPHGRVEMEGLGVRSLTLTTRKILVSMFCDRNNTIKG